MAMILKPHRCLLDSDSSRNNENLETAFPYSLAFDESYIYFTLDVMVHRHISIQINVISTRPAWGSGTHQ